MRSLSTPEGGSALGPRPISKPFARAAPCLPCPAQIHINRPDRVSKAAAAFTTTSRTEYSTPTDGSRVASQASVEAQLGPVLSLQQAYATDAEAATQPQPLSGTPVRGSAPQPATLDPNGATEPAPVDSSVQPGTTSKVQAPDQRLLKNADDLLQSPAGRRLATTEAVSTNEKLPSVVPPVHAHIARLAIRDFALVEQVDVDLQPGLNVITGESGAGKSVLMSALGQVLGAPAPTGCVRAPADVAVIEGTIALGTPQARAAMAHLLEQVGLPTRVVEQASSSSGALQLRRELYSQGGDGGVRSRCFINNAATSLRVMRELGEALVDVNGQHAAQRLRDAGMQMRLLDRIAGTSGLAARFGHLLRQLQHLRAELAALQDFGEESQRSAMQALVDQVEAARTYAGEERELRAQLQALSARRAAMERCSLVHGAIQGDGAGGFAEGVRDLEFHLSSVQTSEQAAGDQLMEDGTEEPPSTSEAAQLVEEAMEQLQAARAALYAADAKVAEYARTYNFSQIEYDEILHRKQKLNRLFKRHGCSSSEELLDKAAQAAAGLDRWFTMEGQTAKQEAEVIGLQQKLAEVGTQLGLRRREAAGKLRAAVEACLTDLAMAGSRFDVRISWQAAKQSSDGITVPESLAASVSELPHHPFQPSTSGFDAVEFLLAAGPAEPLRPLASVASGGESSRIMLALKAAPAAAIESAAWRHSGTSAGSSGAQTLAERKSQEAGVLMLDGDLSGDYTSTGGSVLLNLASTLGEFDLPSHGEEGVAATLEGMGSQVLILDELDSGVGGRLGTAVGQLLRSMVRGGPAAAASQILCVSHLPQVAAHAQHHLAVRKTLSPGGRIITQVQPLLALGEREEEVAAMLGLGLAEAQALMHATAGL